MTMKRRYESCDCFEQLNYALQITLSVVMCSCVIMCSHVISSANI